MLSFLACRHENSCQLEHHPRFEKEFQRLCSRLQRACEPCCKLVNAQTIREQMYPWETTVYRKHMLCVMLTLPYFKQHLLHTLLQGGKSIPAFWVDKAKHSTALHSQTSPAHLTTPTSGTDRSRNQSESSTSSLQSTSCGLSSTPGLPRRFSGSSTSDLEYRFQLSSSCCTCQQHHHHCSKRWATNRWRSSSAPVLSD